MRWRVIFDTPALPLAQPAEALELQLMETQWRVVEPS
jgi:hypothetical protein